MSGFVEHGGQIIYKANVKEVLMEPTGSADGQQRAVGVKLSDGRQFRSKTVISNASRWDTFEGMIGERDLMELCCLDIGRAKYRSESND